MATLLILATPLILVMPLRDILQLGTVLDIIILDWSRMLQTPKNLIPTIPLNIRSSSMCLSMGFVDQRQASRNSLECFIFAWSTT